MRRREFLSASAALALAGPAAGAAAPAENWRLVAYDSRGQPIPPEAYNALIVADLENNPYPRAVLQESGPPAGPFLLSLPMAVPGFGHVHLFADNGGRGYLRRDVAGRELPLNYEFSRSRIGAVERYLEKHKKAGLRFSAELEKRLERARAAQALADKSRHNAGECARLANESLADSLWAGEMAVLEKARQEIEKRGARPGFLFGANAFRVDRGPDYTRRYEELLNFATLPFYRSQTEREEGKVDYSRVDRILAWAIPAGLVTKGHPLVWFHRAGIPGWLKAGDFAAVQKAHREYILKSVARYRPQIHTWDVINEAHDNANILNYSADQLTEMTRLAAHTVREADPTAFRVVNCCCTWSEHVVSGRSQTAPLGRPARSVLNYVKDLIAARVQFEALGLQVYYPARDMFEIDRHLDLFGALGKRVHITELGVSSDNTSLDTGEIKRPSLRYWHGDKWSEPAQADWVEQFYTICYSKPYLDAISWWDFCDPAFIPHGGFLTADLRPKESYHRLLALRRKWQAMG